eukprot:385250-Alexandrium_andersonii.AAC.1
MWSLWGRPRPTQLARLGAQGRGAAVEGAVSEPAHSHARGSAAPSAHRRAEGAGDAHRRLARAVGLSR